MEQNATPEVDPIIDRETFEIGGKAWQCELTFRGIARFEALGPNLSMLAARVAANRVGMVDATAFLEAAIWGCGVRAGIDEAALPSHDQVGEQLMADGLSAHLPLINRLVERVFAGPEEASEQPGEASGEASDEGPSASPSET